MQKNYASSYGQMCYLLMAGIQLLFVPHLLLGVFGFQPAQEVWIRVLGLFVLMLVIFYYFIARHGNERVVWGTVLGRLFIAAGFVVLVLTGMAETPLLGFAAVEIGMALWSWWEVRKRSVAAGFAA